MANRPSTAGELLLSIKARIPVSTPNLSKIYADLDRLKALIHELEEYQWMYYELD